MVKELLIKVLFNDDKNFIAYDILLLEEDKFISYPDNFNLLDKFEIYRVEVIAIGAFEDLLKIETQHKSILASTNNIDTYGEGIVLKPFNDLRLNTEEKERVILKRISEQFVENKPKQVIKGNVIIDENIIETINNMNTEIRLGKVAAKFGILPTEKNKFGQLIIELANDINEELNIDFNVIKKQLTTMVKSYFN
jgi:hypothetical protein